MNSLGIGRILPVASGLCFIFTAFIMPLTFSTRLEDGFELPQVLVALVAVVFLALFHRSRTGADPVTAYYWLFFIVGLVSFAWSSVENSFYFSTQNYLWLISAFFFLVPVGGHLSKRKFMAFAVLAGALGALYSFAQASGLDLAGWTTHFGGRSFATFGNPIFWAGHLLVLLPLALYLALSSKGKWEGTLWWGALALLLGSLLTTQSRGAWLGVLGEMAALVLLNRRQAPLWKGSMGGIIIFLLALLVVPAFQERAISILHYQNKDAQGRYFMWKAALKLWEEKPILGQGPGGYAVHFHRVQAELSQQDPFHPYWTALHPHNDFLETLAERGLVGFLFAAVVVGTLAFRRLKRFDPSRFSTDTAELAILVGIGTQALFNFPLAVVPTACLLALLFNPTWDKGGGEARKEEFQVPSNLKAISSLGMILICAFGFEVFSQNSRLHRAIDQIDSQQYEAALKTLDFEPTVHLFHYLDPRVLTQRATALDVLGRIPEATQTLEELVSAYPDDADAHATLCMLYGKQKRWRDSETAGRKALGLAPCHEQALTNLAMASFLQGHKGDAVQYLSRLEQAEEVCGQSQKALEIRQKISALQRSHR